MFYTVFDKDKYIISEIVCSLNTLIDQTNESASKSLQVLIKTVEKGIIEEDRNELITSFSNIKKEDESIFHKVEELIIRGTIQGAAGNYLYSFLQSVSRTFM